MLPTVFVFYWMITLSLKPQVEATAYPPSFVRFSVTAGGLSRGLHEVSVLPLHVEQPGGGDGLHGARPGGGAAGGVLHRPLAPAAAGRGDPGRAHHPGDRLPDPLVHLLPASPDGGHLRGADPDPPHRGAAHHHLGHDLVLRGRAGRPGGRRADRRLLAPRRLLAHRAAARQARAWWPRRSCRSCSPGTTSSSR